jgi:hypothetical protein
MRRGKEETRVSDTNFEWMLNAKRNGVAPVQVNAGNPAVEVEMWTLYRKQLLAELADVEHVLREAARAAAPRSPR